MTESLFGRAAEVAVRGDAAAAVRIELEPDAPPEIHRPLLAMLRAAAASGTTGAEVVDLVVPIEPLKLLAEYNRDMAELEQRAERYRRRRSTIDAVLETALAAS
jgi:hypothetical protein